MHSGKILYTCHNGVYIIKFVGDVRLNLCSTLDAFFQRMFTDERFKTVIVDLNETDGIDSTSLGLLAKLSIDLKEKLGLIATIVCRSPDINKILLSMGFDQVFVLVEELNVSPEELREFPILQASEQETKDRVLEAHRILMDLSPQNQEAFKDLVETLANDKTSCQ